MADGSFAQDGVKPGRQLRNQESPEVDSRQQSEMADSLKRSITLIFWYKPNTDPIRFHHHVPTFPLFQLSHFPQLVNELGLGSGSYVDMFNDQTCQWEQIMISTVRAVESEQRLLYKIRKNLFEGLSDQECPGLSDEVAILAKLGKAAEAKSASTSVSGNGKLGPKPVKVASSNRKRSAPDEPTTSAPPANKYHITDYTTNPYAHAQAPGQAYPQNLSVPNAAHNGVGPPQGPPQSTLGGQMGYPYAHAAQQTHYGAAPMMAIAPPYPPYGAAPHTHQGPTPTPPHLHPQTGPPMGQYGQPSPAAIKRWPNDYTVSEVTVGFAQMDNLMSQTPSTTQRIAFERVFGTRYVKSTVCRHRGVWKRAGKVVGSMGVGEREMWGDFVRRMEGRRGEAPKPLMASAQQQQPTTMTGSVGVADGVVSGGRVAMSNGNGNGNGVVTGVSVEEDEGDEQEEEEEDEAQVNEAVMGSLGPPPERTHGHAGLGSAVPSASSQNIRQTVPVDANKGDGGMWVTSAPKRIAFNLR